MKRILFFLLLFCANKSFAQQTVGVFQNDSLAYNGYTLLFPNVSRFTWLIDNCGNVVHEWESDFNPGLVAYLLENGDLLRTARIGSNFNGGGSGGRIERFNWEGDLIWAYNHSSEDFHQHHDIEFMPNGNILIIAWERYTPEEAIEKGRNPQALANDGVWAEHIVEVKPVGDSDVEIVWEWHLWDHMVQDFDETKENFGVVADHPELWDINAGNSGVDWIHFNSIDYNPDLDQIILSSRHLSEVYIIDHSTTSEEAATHEGGNAGKGGDILYRWGNPEMYGRGTEADKKLFGQHDAQWIETDRPDEGKLLVFNNGIARPAGNYSTVDIWEAPIDADGNYIIDGNAPFGPEALSWTFGDVPNTVIYSSNISGAQRLPNGNTLICEGRTGHLLEVDYNGTYRWRYISPVVGQGFVTQGNTVSNNNVFRAYRYGVDYPAFEDRELEAGEPLELEPTNQDCIIYDGMMVGTNDFLPLENVRVVGNPVSFEMLIENNTQETIFFEITDLMGRSVLKGSSAEQMITQNVETIEAGLYLIRFSNVDNNRFFVEKIMKF